MDIQEELKVLLAALDEGSIDYALRGGLAMAVYGLPRATLDIDLIIESESLEKVTGVVRELGYTSEALPMTFADGRVEIRRVSKQDTGSPDVLTLDLLLATDALRDVWQSRRELQWEQGAIRVVSSQGLIALKSLRKSGQDLDDIEYLRGLADEG